MRRHFNVEEHGVEKYTIEDLYEGQYYEKSFVITEDMGRAFAEISQDFNPIHLEHKAAEESRSMVC